MIFDLLTNAFRFDFLSQAASYKSQVTGRKFQASNLRLLWEGAHNVAAPFRVRLMNRCGLKIYVYRKLSTDIHPGHSRPQAAYHLVIDRLPALGDLLRANVVVLLMTQ